ncbi:MAG TPA: hypothetical protein VGO83_04900, partial [Thermoleophilaceae bacterium]|nr:hypothetical protein [Thermoleophilaceae bacterium]
ARPRPTRTTTRNASSHGQISRGGGSSGPGGGTDLSEPDELDTADEHSTLAPETEPSGSDDTVPEPEPLDSSGPG